jgi:hypothetical protein
MLCLLVACVCAIAKDEVAARLAAQARQAQNEGQLVRAYMLYAAAAARDSHTATYRLNRDMLAPIAQLLTKANVQSTEDISAEIKQAEDQSIVAGPPIVEVSAREWRLQQLKDVPHLQPSGEAADFNLRANTRTLFSQVASVFGITVLFDRDVQLDSAPIRFQIER